MTNISGPRRPSTGTGPGSGVASNLRLAEYSPSLSLPVAFTTHIIRNHDDPTAPASHDRPLPQALDAPLLAGPHHPRRHPRLPPAPPPHGRDHQHLLPDADGHR